REGSEALDINPEEEELREEGFLMLAQHELMRDTDQYEEYLAKELGKNVEDVREKPKDIISFPIKAIMKEGSIIVGGRGSGKSNLAKLIVKEALACRIQVKVLDSSLAWKSFPLPKIKVRKGRVECKPNAIYDLSRLSVVEMREFVSAMITEDTMRAIELTDLGVKAPLLYVLEEVQNLIFPNTLRMLKYQEISRFATQGRNFNLSYVGITQRLSAVDVNLVEISGCKFWFKLEGENNLRKARAWLDKYHVWRLRELKLGEAYQQIGSNIDFIKVPKFEAKRFLKPMQIHVGASKK
ncbi:MAG: hypothetical protein OEZ35_08480, partial [Candidatus Bathyarchaeota archaeon]|nr:hypothetical protein [Candidatus Bathyarchaeota archaeon]